MEVLMCRQIDSNQLKRQIPSVILQQHSFMHQYKIMKYIVTFLIIPLSSVAQTIITGTIFQDYNSNGIRDVNSPGFYEGGAPSIPVELNACQNELQMLAYSDEEGQYTFNVTEGCYYIYMREAYSISPYVQPGEVTQMVTNQVNPDSRKSVPINVSDGQEAVVNVGIVAKTSVAAVQETSTSTTEMTTSTENYSEAFFAQDDGNDTATDVIDTDVFLVGNSTNHDDDGVAFADITDVPSTTTTAATEAAVVEEAESTVNADNLFGDSEGAIVEPTSFSGGDTSTSSDAAATGDIFYTSSTVHVELAASDNETSYSTTVMTESTSAQLAEATAVPEDDLQDADEEEAAVDEDIPSTDTIFQSDGEAASSSVKRPTSSPSATKAETPQVSSEEDADKLPAIESGTESASDASVNASDEESTDKKSTQKPTATPTVKPTTCIGCELSLAAKVRIQLDNIDSALSDNSKILFESVCASFLEEQLSIATPPISNLDCVVMEENVEAQSPDRSLRGEYSSGANRKLSQLYLADIEVTGTALSTPSYQTPESIKLKELCVGTFTVQGFLFVRALKEAEEESSFGETVFQSVENARGVMTYDASEATTGEELDDPSNPDGGWLSTGVLATIAAGCLFCAVCFILFIAVKARTSKNRCNDLDGRSGSASNKSGKDVDSTIYDEYPELARPSPTNSDRTGPTVASRTSPTNSQGSGPTFITPVSIRSNTEEVEVGIIPSGFSSEQEEKGNAKVASMLNSRVRRDVIAPTGKLGIMVANTAGFGPAVHTMRDGSPMEGMIFVNDIIIAINGVNTREFTATQITQMMKDTVNQERKITVLSSVR